ncbi:MAG TPA: DUF1592 domain-containing protein [Polyangia bacterium]|nr:DUF1592 domain-containing protein [Polyangia bacterium]
MAVLGMAVAVVGQSGCASSDGRGISPGAGADGNGGSGAAVDSGSGSGGRGGGGGGGGGGASGGSTGNVDAAPVSHDLAITRQQVAIRLARVLWNGAPDAALLTLIDSRAVTTREDVGKLALEMLGDQRARAGVGAFYRWWLRLDDVATMRRSPDPFTPEPEDLPKDPKVFPLWTAAVSADAAKETETFGVNVTLDMKGSFRTLMTAPFSYLNARLAGLYGATGVTGDDLRKVALDPMHRAGLLTQPALQALTSHAAPDLSHVNLTIPPRRGKYIRDRFYCEPVLVNTQIGVPPLPAMPSQSIRQRFQILTEVPGQYCVNCHVLQQINTLGFAFEEFDAIGRLRTNDDVGAPVDVSGRLKDDSGAEVAFDGPVQLAGRLAEMSSVQRCLGKQWLTFAMGRPLASDEYAGLNDINRAFVASDLDLRTLIAAVVSSEAFLSPPASTSDAGTVDAAGPVDGPRPEGCAQAAAIFSKHGCTTLCHATKNALSYGGFDMETAGWAQRMTSAGPSSNAPLGNQCKNTGVNYLDRRQPATGLFLEKLSPNPPCGSQMPLDLPKLSADELACIQKWANNLAAGGPGQ